MQMTSKLEEPGRKAAIINKTKREDVGTSPGVFLRARWKDEAGEETQGIQADKKRPGPPRGPLSGEEGAKRKKEKNASLTASPTTPPPKQYTKVRRSATSPALAAFSPSTPPHTSYTTPHPSHQQQRARNKSQADHLLLGTGRSGALSSTEALLRNCLNANFFPLKL